MGGRSITGNINGLHASNAFLSPILTLLCLVLSTWNRNNWSFGWIIINTKRLFAFWINHNFLTIVERISGYKRYDLLILCFFFFFYQKYFTKNIGRKTLCMLIFFGFCKLINFVFLYSIFKTWTRDNFIQKIYRKLLFFRIFLFLKNYKSKLQ